MSAAEASRRSTTPPSVALAAVLVDELIRCGVREAVLCPGSRSAPLAYALAEADRAGRVRLHVRTDERVGAFLALGLAKATGQVVPVVTTSGTAPANLHPGLLEAHESGIPVLAVTADRPAELRGTGANQTTDQAKMFGTAVRWWHELGVPETGVPVGVQAAWWRTAVDRAVATALGGAGRPGPVHLNVPLREPLAPPVAAGDQVAEHQAGGSEAGGGWQLPPGRPDGAPWTRLETTVAATLAQPGRGPGGAPGDAPGPSLVPPQPRTLVLLGDLSGAWGQHALGADLTSAYRQVLTWARRAGYPVIAEPFGPRDLPSDPADPTEPGDPGKLVVSGEQAESVVLPHGGLLALAPDLVADLAPQRIIVAGRLTLSRQVAALLRAPDLEVVIASDGGRWADASHVAHRVVDLAALTKPSPGHGPPTDDDAADPSWTARWRQAADVLHAAVRGHLASDFPQGPAVVSALLRALPTGSRLFLGSSALARDAQVARSHDGADVWASRGLAGIDGCLSTAIGMALAAPGVPTYALVGDLTFLHDANALLIGPDEPLPNLTIVVLNDDGGSIFSTLEYGDPDRLTTPWARDTLRRVFTTPTGAGLAARCAAHRVPHVVARDAAELTAAVQTAPHGLRVVEVDARGQNRREYDAVLARATRRALRTLGT